MSGAAAAIHFLMVLICLTFARAPGWKAYRVFALAAFLMGVYATNNALVIYKIDAFKNSIPRINIAIAALVPALWIVFSRLRDKEILTRVDRLLLALLLALGALTQVPGLVVTGTHITHLETLGLTNRTPDVTFLGHCLFGVSLLAMLLVTGRYIRKARRGTTVELLSAAGMVFFALLAFEEVLVALEVLGLPYLADLGFAGVTISFAAELYSRVSTDSIALRALNQDLGKLIESRSNDLAETREALLEAERHAAIGQLASGVGHEINNPLAYISGNLTFLQEYQGVHTWNEDELEAIEEALEGVRQIGRIVRDLTIFSGSFKENQEVADVQRATRTAIRILGLQRDLGLQISTNITTGLNVRIPESKLVQVLVNLLANASQACAEQRANIITVLSVIEGENQVIEVTDRGTGIDAANLEHIFDPLYTTKEVGQGTGLGLYVCREIVEAVGGSISVQSRPGEGATFTVKLPGTELQSTETTLAKDTERDEVVALPEEVSIYIIDDEALVTRAIRRMLGGSNVIVENDSTAALDHLHDNNYDVVICDLMMPELSGMELYKELESTNPSQCSRFLFVTGGVITPAAEAFIERQDIRVLPKPFMPSALKTAIYRIAQGQHS